LRLPNEKVLFLDENERKTSLSSSSKRNSEHYVLGQDGRLSNFSQDINVEDPFFDQTMRARHTKIPDDLISQNSYDPLRGNLNLQPQHSVEFINRQLNNVNKKNQKLNDSGSIVNQIFKKSKMTSDINNNKKRFFKLATSFKGVCLARCSPSMKSLVTEVLCEKMNKIVLAIGDGGNDVGMIQISHVGIGILGKEGNQAALAADFNINKFR